jgi:Tol biopolymer transport system component
MIPPADGINGVDLLPVVIVARDSHGMLDYGFSGRVTLRLRGGTLQGDTTVTAVSGLATFANVRALGVKSSYTLVANAEGGTVTPAISLPFSVSAPSHQIAFAATRGIYVVNADESGVGALVLDTAAAFPLYGRPAWSPDGARLVFQKDSAIEIVNADGSGLTRVAIGFDPVWSQDGTRIRFAKAVSSGGAQTEIDEVAVDGSSASRLAVWPTAFHSALATGFINDGYSGDFGSRLTWSPDLSQVVFERLLWDVPVVTYCGGDVDEDCGVFTRLYVMNADGSGLRPVTADSVAAVRQWGVAWSPDGRRLAFVSAGTTSVATIAVDGSSPPVSVIGPPFTESFGSPSWSPDGKEIAVAIDETSSFTGSGILIASADGTGGVRRLTNIFIALSNYFDYSFARSSRVPIQDLAWSPR